MKDLGNKMKNTGIFMNMSKWLITIIVLAAAVFALFTYKSSQQAAQAEQSANMPEPAAMVNAAPIKTLIYQDTLNVNGEVQAFKRLSLRNELAGQIISLNAPSGNVVQAGQTLLELDHSEEEARLIAAEAQLVLNKQTYKRYIELRKNKEISEDFVDQAKAAVQIAKSDIAVLRTAINKKKIISPFNAKVGIHHLEVGQYLDKNSTVLELVGVNEYTYIDFFLPQIYQEIAVGTVVKINALDNVEPFDAEIIAVDPQLSHQSRHLKYRAQIASSILHLKPNTLISVSVPLGAAQEMMSLPDLAITHNQLGNFVYVLEPEAEGAYRAKPMKVELGPRQGDHVIVLSGVEVGQLIATKGAFKLFPNMKVYITETAPNS